MAWRVLPWRFVLHVPAGHEAQFGIDVLRQPAQGGFVTAAPGFQRFVISAERASMDSPFSPWASKNIPETWPLLRVRCRLYRRKENKVSA